MNKWAAFGLLVALAVGCTPSERGEPIVTDTVAATPTTVAVTTTTSTVPSTTTSSTTSTSTTSAPTTATPTTSAPTDPVDEAVEVAQQLATAFADGDWDAARRISPNPVWDDATYEEGFAGLEDATVVLGGTRELDDRIVLYLFQVAHESRATGPQTSHYCVRWDYLLSSRQIERIAGTLYFREDGTVPASESRRAAFVCDGFDEPGWPYGNSSSPATLDPPLPVPSPVPDPVQPSLPATWSVPSDWIVVTSRGQDYICDEKLFGDFDCVRYYGGNPPLLIGWPDLRCSETLWGFKCTKDGYYPSELDGYEVTTVAANRVLCRWNQCWIWESWENPSSATLGSSDYECSGLSCTET